ncbi:MAG: DciA family protein [Thermochromatium sp.]
MRLRFRHIRDYLGHHGSARERSEQDRHTQTLVAEIRALLPETLGAHCLDLKLADGRLTLFLDSTAWLTRARFLADEILTSLKSYHVNVIGFQVRLPEHESFRQQATSRRARLSEAAVRHLLEAADRQRDPRLREAFRRLARHGPRKPPEGAD